MASTPCYDVSHDQVWSILDYVRAQIILYEFI